MALAELQAAAARLSVDATARRRLREDPAGFAREAGLDEAELRSLVEKAAELEKFARSLVNKRAGEAGRAIPLTRAALGEKYRAIFSEFAEETGVAREPALDAMAFLRWLNRLRETEAGLRDLARYELAGLLFRHGRGSLRAGVFRFRGTASNTMPKLCLAVWWRPVGSTAIRYFQWPRQA